MPGLNRTGPTGKGPMTGRGSGKCVPPENRDSDDSTDVGRGRSNGAGRGQDSEAGRGQGRGRRNGRGRRFGGGRCQQD